MMEKDLRSFIFGIIIVLSILILSLIFPVEIDFVKTALLSMMLIVQIIIVLISLNHELEEKYYLVCKISFIVGAVVSVLFLSYGAFEIYQMQAQFNETGEFRQYINQQLAKYQ